MEDERIVKPLRAVFLSDLHCKMYGLDGTFLLEKIKEIGPDIVLIGGDMITAYPGHKNDKVISFLGQLSDAFPIIYAYGNHELRLSLYPEEYGDAWDRYVSGLSGKNITVKDNETVHLEEYGIDVFCFSAGREFYKRMTKTEMPSSYIGEKLGNPNPSSYSILLAHDPRYFDTYEQYGADLTLSGHVHGGIMRLPLPSFCEESGKTVIRMRGVLSPACTLFPKYDSGYFTKNGKKIIISRGLGTHTLPIRIFNPGDLIVIDFKPSDLV